MKSISVCFALAFWTTSGRYRRAESSARWRACRGGVRLLETTGQRHLRPWTFLSGAFNATSDMLTARGEGYTATLLNNGRVLITGGFAPYPAITSSAELYTQRVLVPAPALFSLSGDGHGQGAMIPPGPPESSRPAILPFQERCWNLRHRVEGWECHPGASRDRRPLGRDPVFRQCSRVCRSEPGERACAERHCDGTCRPSASDLRRPPE